MREVTYWEADDGTKFDYEWDCQEYEWKLNVKSNSHMYALLSSSRVLLDNNEPKSYDDCSYIFLKNDDSARALFRAWDEDMTGACCPNFVRNYTKATPGLWAFDWDSESWYHVGIHISDLQKKADECMKAINGG